MVVFFNEDITHLEIENTQISSELSESTSSASSLSITHKEVDLNDQMCNFDNKNTYKKDDRTIWVKHLLELTKPLFYMAKLDFNSFKIKKYYNVNNLNIGYLECFSRIFAGISTWIISNDNDNKYENEQKKIISSLICDCFDKLMPFFDKEMDLFSIGQSIVECAYICYGFIISKNKIWLLLKEDTQKNIITIFKKVRLLIVKWHFCNNWYLFHGIIETFFKTINIDYNEEFIIEMIHSVNGWYCGDGFYFDGEKKFKMDYYNSYVIQPFFIEILKVFNSSLLDIAIQRCIRYSEFLERIIGSDGTFPPLGRSITYRFAAFHLLSYCIYNNHISVCHNYGQLRNSLTKVLINILNKDIYDSDGFLNIGFNCEQNSLQDYYSNTGSCYITTIGLLPLGLEVNHPFWNEPSRPFTQESCWKFKSQIAKYIINDEFELNSTKTIIILTGEKGRYCEELTLYLNKYFHNKKTIFIDECENQMEKITYETEKKNIVVAYNSDFTTIKKHLNNYRVIEFYIGEREDVDCTTFFTHSNLNIQPSLNSFCFKSLQPRRILLVSPGGSACTSFLQFLQNKKIIINTPNSYGDINDGLKHCLDNSYLVNAYDPTHVIYQYGDLDTTIRSLFRRNLLEISYFYDNIQRFMNPLSRKSYRYIKFNTFEDYIKDVLKTKSENLGIIKHWASWKSSSRNIYFIHYKDIHKDTKLDDFIGVPKGTCSEFTIKERQSKRLLCETDEYINIIRDIDLRERCNKSSL